jgi:uncharacterized protein (DUF58 family)
MLFVAGLVLVLGGAAVGVAGLVALGVIVCGLAAARSIWAAAGSEVVSYRRELGSDRAVCGDEIDLDVRVHNRGPLPLPWVRTLDQLGHGVAVRHRLHPDHEPARGELVSGWTLGPFETVVRHFRILALRRGTYELGPATVSAGDLLGRAMPLAGVETRDAYVVRPRMVGVVGFDEARDWDGDRRARHGLAEDPSRFAGVRPYRPGDQLRRIHWRASARTGSPLTRRYDPSRRPDVVLVLDLRVPTGPGLGPADRDEATEGLMVATMSLARALHAEGTAVGLATNGFSGDPSRTLFLTPSATPGGMGLIGDVLARLDAIPAISMPRLLGEVSRRVAPGTTVVTIGAVDPASFLPALRGLARSGFFIAHVAYGEGSAPLAERARAAGIAARSARLDGPWATSSRLELAG